MLSLTRNLPKCRVHAHPTWPQHKPTHPKYSTDAKKDAEVKKVNDQVTVIIDGVSLHSSAINVGQKKPLPLKEVCKIFLLRMLAVAAVAYAVVKIEENDKSSAGDTPEERAEKLMNCKDWV